MTKRCRDGHEGHHKGDRHKREQDLWDRHRPEDHLRQEEGDMDLKWEGMILGTLTDLDAGSKTLTADLRRLSRDLRH